MEKVFAGRADLQLFRCGLADGPTHRTERSRPAGNGIGPMAGGRVVTELACSEASAGDCALAAFEPPSDIRFLMGGFPTSAEGLVS